ncbi:hypothetical protein [Cellulosilyticum sp. I15G10I2]|uniref:hypothetical protein n=1 Tax=Cellulosilyticum sp. I15G10I2 TaxID=1892843 RepID=UPI00114CD395|nr:hypothetical protein [Cellulosilyticum sp. I15G10I2]
MDEAIKGAVHSILVMIDGGDELTDEFNIDLINTHSKKSLKNNIAIAFLCGGLPQYRIITIPLLISKNELDT